jgi:CDP-diglyceride synthetase
VTDVLSILLKGLAGGSLVLVFAAISEVLKPKRFAGLFGAAPAVALAGLGIVLATKPVNDAHENTIGMLAGCAGMIAYAALAAPLLKRLGAVKASALALCGWFTIAAVTAIPLLA